MISTLSLCSNIFKSKTLLFYRINCLLSKVFYLNGQIVNQISHAFFAKLIVICILLDWYETYVRETQLIGNDFTNKGDPDLEQKPRGRCDSHGNESYVQAFLFKNAFALF